MRRFDGLGDVLEQLAPHRLQIHRITQPRSEGRDGSVGVVASAVEAAIDDSLNSDAERVEQGDRCKCRRIDGDGRREPEPPADERDDADVHSHNQTGDDGVRQRAAYEAVNFIEAVPEHRDADADGKRGDAELADGMRHPP